MGSDDPNDPGRKRNRAKTVVEADMPDIGNIFKEAQGGGDAAANDPWGGSGQDWGSAPTQPPMTPPQTSPPADDPWATPSDSGASDPWSTSSSGPDASSAPPPSGGASASSNNWDSGGGAAPPPSGGAAPPPGGAGAPPPSGGGAGAPPPSTAMQTTGGGGDDNFSHQEIQAGKTMAIVAHVGNIFCLPLFAIPLIQKDNRYALFHAKQAAAGWAVIVAWMVVMGMGGNLLAFLTVILACITVPLTLIGPAAIGGYFAYMANEGKAERFPVLGELVEDLLSSVQAPKQLGS